MVMDRQGKWGSRCGLGLKACDCHFCSWARRKRERECRGTGENTHVPPARPRRALWGSPSVVDTSSTQISVSGEEFPFSTSLCRERTVFGAREACKDGRNRTKGTSPDQVWGNLRAIKNIDHNQPLLEGKQCCSHPQTQTGTHAAALISRNKRINGRQGC